MNGLRLRSALLAVPGPPAADADLLAAFAAGRDQAAFAELVRRHARLVRGAARRVLGDPAGADDVAQAAFLTLARKAGAAGWGPTVGPWLYRVTLRLAFRAKARAARRPTAPLADVAARPTEPSDPLTWAEARSALDDGLARLPERLRAPLVLCYLDGLTRDEAAAALGCTPDALRGRLDRGRAKLRAYLTGRGLGLPAVLAGVTASDVGGRAAFAAATARAAAGVRVSSGLAAGGWGWATAAVLLAGAATAVGLGGGDRPAEAPPPRVAETPAPRVDVLGDPLPPGALARMGSARLHHGANVRAVAISGDGTLIASVGHDESVRLWETESGKEVPFRPGPGKVMQVARSGNGLVALVRDGKSNRLFTLPAGPAVEMKGYTPMYDTYKGWLTPDGRTYLWSDPIHNPNGTHGGWEMRVTDIRTGATAALWHREKESGFDVRFAADSKTAAIMCGDRSLEVWNLVSRTKLFTTPKPEAKFFESFDLSAAGEAVARVDPATKGVRLWDVATGRELPPLPDQARDEHATLAFSPDGRTLACGMEADKLKVVRFWDYRAGKTLGDVQAYSGQHMLAFSADGRRLAGACGDGVRVWDPVARKPLHDWGGHTYSPWAVVWSPDGTRLVSGAVYADPVARVWDALTGRKVFDLPGHRLGVGAVAYSPDGRQIATSGQAGAAKLWDAVTGEALHTFEFPTWGDAVAFAPDGRRLVATGKAGLHVFDVPGRRPVRVVPLGRPFRAHFLDDGRVLVRGHDCGTRIIDIATGEDRPAPDRLPDHVTPTSSNRRVGLGGGEDRAFRRFPMAGGPGVVVTEPLNGKTDKGAPDAMGADQTPDGRMVAVGYRNGTTVVYEAATARERFRLPGHAGTVLGVAYSPDGTRLATSSGDTTVIVWDATGSFLPADVKDTADAWAKLAGADAAAGFAAVRWLAARPAEAVPYLSERLKPVPEPDAKAVAGQIAKLDAPDFADREAASKALAAYGDVVGLALAAAARSGSAEVMARAGRLLARLDGDRPTGDRLRAVRAVEVLERIGTTEAVAVLRSLAGGAAGATVTREAKAAADRHSRK